MYWTTPLELYCYLYFAPWERARIQAFVNQKGSYDGEYFHIYHQCDPFHLRVRKGQTDDEFQRHLANLFCSIDVEMIKEDHPN